MRTPLALTTLLACLLALALPAAALANATDDRIVADCQHSQTGELTGSYTKAQLRHAKDNLPSDVLEYSGCYDAINQPLLASGGGGSSGGNGPGGGGGGGGPVAAGAGAPGGGVPGASGAAGAPPVANATPPASAARPVAVAGAPVAPGALPEIGRDAHRLPTALLVGLVLLGLAALAPAALTIGRRVVARRAP
jgi:hypothetical protein